MKVLSIDQALIAPSGMYRNYSAEEDTEYRLYDKQTLNRHGYVT